MKIKIQECHFEQLDKEVKILEVVNSDFVILDDNSYSDVEDIHAVSKEIEKYKYTVNNINISDVMHRVASYLEKNIEFSKNVDLIIAVGEGGTRTLEALNKFNIYNNLEQKFIVWSRNWKGESSNEFITNIERIKLQGRKIILIEDVIATGETLYNIREKIKQMGGEVKGIISAIISYESPIKNKSFCKMIVGTEIKSNNKNIKDPFWYPPIYSLRHLFYGDKEMPYFYKTLNKRYFNNESNVENLIKKRRS